MKKNLSTILAAISCLLLVICLFQISNLNQRIGTLERNVVNQMDYVRNDVNGIASNIRTSLEEQASILADSAWEFGTADYDARTVELVCSVSPKEYSFETAAAILVGDTEYPMTLSNGTFTARVSIPLFGETRVAKVMFHEGDTTRTELLDWYLSPRYDYLLNVYASYSDGSATGHPENGIYHYHRDSVINIDADSKQENGVKAITLVEVMNGKELGRTSIPLDNTAFFENYQSEDGARPEPAKPVTQSAEKSEGPFYYALEKDFEIPYDSTWLLCIELEDSNGLLYRCIVDRQVISDSGEPVDDGYWWLGIEASIYDADGNVLYAPDETLYK